MKSFRGALPRVYWCFCLFFVVLCPRRHPGFLSGPSSLLWNPPSFTTCWGSTTPGRRAPPDGTRHWVMQRTPSERVKNRLIERWRSSQSVVIFSLSGFLPALFVCSMFLALCVTTAHGLTVSQTPNIWTLQKESLLWTNHLRCFLSSSLVLLSVFFLPYYGVWVSTCTFPENKSTFILSSSSHKSSLC